MTPFKDLAMYVWQDAYATLEDDCDSEAGNLTITVGQKVKEDKEFIYISNYYCSIAGDYCSPFMAIPKSLIKKVIPIGYKKNNTKKTKKTQKRA